ncbi:MAG TPA: D-alanyl-D-alanine carboxypeptidase family protein [Tepidiformaceae bacterium]|nr:D-alanyl-D-alanine carboxypeptidase family protein [Tepidiformaceae bacterium]
MGRIGLGLLGASALMLLVACGGDEPQEGSLPLQGGGGNVAAVPPLFVPMPVGTPRDTGPVLQNVPGAEVRTPLPAPSALPPVPLDPDSRPEVSARAAVVVDEASGAVLYEKNGYQPLSPASTTKIATAILAIEQGNLDAVVQTDVDSKRMTGSTVMGLEPGDRFTLRDLLYGLLLPSGNDAALAIGRSISGSDSAFVGEMNELLFRMGMDTAHFTNPHGLGGRGHVISARDLAMLARYAMTLPEYREIMLAPSHRASGSRDIDLISLNSFTFSYPGADGAKVGYTRSAGRTLVASATRYGHRLYVVVLNAQARDEDAARLLDWAFANHRWPD